MLHDRDIICISSIDWDFIWQGHQEIMSVLARNGNRVLFVENTGVRTPTFRDIPRIWRRFTNWRKGFKGIRKISDNLFVYSPLTFPFPHSPFATRLNRSIMLSVIRRWMNSMGFSKPVMWSFLPTGIVLGILDEIQPEVFIYYCIDDFVSSSKGARKVKRMEELVIRRANLVFTTSHKLYNRCAALNPKTHLFPFGVSIDNYNRARDDASLKVPSEMRSLKKPLIGYVGGIHKWIDMPLLKKIALARKDISFVLIGPAQTDLAGLDKLSNVALLGQRDGSALPKYIKFFDVGIIPYRVTAYTENVYPTKINEYLAMGKPIISTKIPEVVKFAKQHGAGLVYFIENGDELDDVLLAMKRDESQETRARRILVANQNSWRYKIEAMSDLIDKEIADAERGMDTGWLSRFKRIYVASKRKVFISALWASLIYLVVFHTPFMWFLASPLKIVEEPSKADAIVVFGGGVGEGGRPGPSTVERAHYSIELYQKAYASRIIFSSGYTYKYNDAENMRLLARSMDVPKDRIFLEQEAGSTYENVRFVTDILKKNGWKRIILITSAYNTRRAKLLFDKISPGIAVYYCPVKDSQFYFRYGIIRLDQLDAIIHEYLGIIYYRLKGYI